MLKCPDPVAPANGKVIPTGLDVDAKAVYTCNAGFKLDGEAVATCTAAADGTASFQPNPPTCQRI